MTLPGGIGRIIVMISSAILCECLIIAAAAPAREMRHLPHAAGISILYRSSSILANILNVNRSRRSHDMICRHRHLPRRSRKYFLTSAMAHTDERKASGRAEAARPNVSKIIITIIKRRNHYRAK